MSERKKVTLPALFAKVAEGMPITWLTCYDYPTAHLQEQAGIDMILVGDSLGGLIVRCAVATSAAPGDRVVTP